MRQSKITPSYRGMTAPTIIVRHGKEATEEQICKMAREKSGLGRFSEWAFGRY